MARSPSTFKQADIARALRAAKQAGAAEVELQINDHARIIIRLVSSTGEQNDLANLEKIVL